MALTPAEMDRKLDEHFHYEMRDDVQGGLATMASDVDHDIVGWPTGPSRGRDQAKGFYDALFADLADGKVTSTKRLYGHNFMVDDSVWEGRAPGRPFGLEGKNRRLRFRLLHVLEFSDEGLIKRENVWVDLAAIAQQLPQN